MEQAIKTALFFADLLKRRVYENFDVKTTKSIMLRKIYEAAVHNSKEKLFGGDLVLFENIELQQCNADDIVMILNVLQDSKIKNQENCLQCVLVAALSSVHAKLGLCRLCGRRVILE